MRSIPTLFGAAALAGLALCAPGRSVAQPQATEPMALRKAHEECKRLGDELARVNAEIAELKHANRSVRNDYRLRERMADAEALAQKLGRAEARLHALERPTAAPPREIPLPPQESPQDGSVELEAKADLFADQASKLARQADLMARSAEQLRARTALRRRAGAWDRDPFAGLEGSKRNLAVPAPTQRPTLTTGSATTAPGTAMAPAGSTADSAKGATASSGVGAIESSASKTSPVATAASADRTSEQRLYLDPTTAAELRQVLGAGSASHDPDQLDRAAGVLRARARELSSRADSLRRRSRAP